jgi:hypothetical protein
MLRTNSFLFLFFLTVSSIPCTFSSLDSTAALGAGSSGTSFFGLSFCGVDFTSLAIVRMAA